MSHLVLARKYRPKDFNSVVGQDSIVSTLLSAIKQNRMAHALLFTGSRGVGKTSVARLVAKSLVCIGEYKPCNKCFQCESVDNFNSLDVIEIDGASNTSVDDVRDLRESAKYQPTSAKYKIFIIDEVHMLSQNAFNALLKILEEPPSHIIFIFATTEVHKLPKTILSRCQRYDFKRFSENTVYLNLKDILIKENYSFEESAIKLLAKLADGSMRDALSMLEQVLHLGLTNYTDQDVSAILGVIDHQSVKELTKAMLDKNTALGLKIIHAVYEKGLDICQLIQDITERFRNLALMVHVEYKDLQNIILDLSQEDLEEASNYSPQDLKRCFSLSLDCIIQVFSAKNPLLAMELVLLRFTQRADFKDALDISYCLQKLDSVLNNKPINSGEEKKKTIDDFFDVINKNYPFLMAHLRHCVSFIDQEKQTLTLSFDKSFHYEQANEDKNKQIITKTLKEVFSNLKLEIIYNKPENNMLENNKSIAQQEEEAKKKFESQQYEKAINNPLIKTALELFKDSRVFVV